MDQTPSHDQATLRALKAIDPDLAGLFTWGRTLCDEPDRPGLAYLIAHAGRELTNGVIAQLAEEDESAGSENLHGDSRDEEFRHRIANAIGLSANHPVVRRWFDVHQVFAKAAHVRVPGPKMGPLRPAFAELAELLYGRIGDYFQTQVEIDAIADSDPSTVSFAALRQLLLRPVQRRRFFSRLARVEWLAPLMAEGFFRHPPRRQVFRDKSWRSRPWPEGDYLLRMAPDASDSVAAALASVPDDNDNPAVWITVANAIVVLPGDEGASLTRKLIKGLELPYSRLFAHAAVSALVTLAKNGRTESFALLKALLTAADEPSVPAREAEASTQDYIKILRDKRRELSWHDEWVLDRIEEFALDQLIERVLPLLRDVDGMRLLTILAARLDHLSKMVARADNAFAAAIHAAENGNNGAKMLDVDGGDVDSSHWSRELDDVGHSNSVRARLAVETFKTAEYLAGSDVAVSTLAEKLEKRPNTIFRRMVYALIAKQTQLDDSLRARVDAFVSSDEAIWPPFGARETAALLRAHFADAADASQQAFLAALERGPDEEYVSARLDFLELPDTPEERAERIADWQRLRLRWFHDRIPRILQPLAKRLGVVSSIPSARDQALDETGSWFSGVYSGTRRSPIAWQELAQMAPEDVARYLMTWQPAEEVPDPFERPTIEGLTGELTTLAATEPGKTEALLPVLAVKPVPIGYLTALLIGLRSAIQQKKNVAVPAVLDFAAHAWERAEREGPESKRERQDTRWAADAVADLLRQLVSDVTLDASQRERIWNQVKSFSESDLPWASDPEDQVPTTYGAASHASFSEASGRLTEVIFALAVQDFVASHPKAKWPPPAQSNAAHHVIPILEAMLSRSGPAAFAAHGVFGRHLYDLVWIAHDWTLARLPRLFDGGSEDPGRRPAWCVYLQSSYLRDPAFTLLRHWYARHAARLPRNGSAPVEDPNWDWAEALAIHVIVACIRGLCRPGDSDALVENTFDRIPVKDRIHAYWAVWRDWSPAKTSPPAKLVRNVIAFWTYRIERLETAPPGLERDEEVEGLFHLIATPYLPSRDVIPLAKRTTALLRRKQRVTHFAWERLGQLAAEDPAGTFAVVEALIDRMLESDYHYLSFDDAAPPIRSAIRVGGELCDRALALLARIGNEGFDEFGALWREAQREQGRTQHDGGSANLR